MLFKTIKLNSSTSNERTTVLVKKNEKKQIDREKKLKCRSFLNLTSIAIFLQKREKIPIYRKERTALTFSASLPLLKWNHRRKGLQNDVGKNKSPILVLCSLMDTRHLYLCCDWTNEQSLAVAFRNWRQKKKRGCTDPVFHRPVRVRPSWFLNVRIDLHLWDLCAYVDFFSPVKLINNMWGTSMRSELRSE